MNSKDVRGVNMNSMRFYGGYRSLLGASVVLYLHSVQARVRHSCSRPIAVAVMSDLERTMKQMKKGRTS